MATLFDISAEVPKGTVQAFQKAFNRYRDELGNSQKVAVRRGTIALIRGLRARTAKAKKQAPLRDVQRSEKPRYLTPKGRNQISKPAWRILRHNDKGAKWYIHAADTRAEARAKHAQYTKWGLARKSWGWFMHALFNRNNPESANPKAKIDSRMTEGYIREIVTGVNPRVEVLIVNKLDYIRAAIPEGALSVAMSKATNSINAQIDKGIAKARKELT